MKADELKNKAQPIEQGEKKEKKKREPVRKSLLGELIGKDRGKVYDKTSEYYGSTFFKLKTRNIENMENNAPELVYAFKETLMLEATTEKEAKRKEEIWRLLEKDEYLGRRYIIYCF
jgi:hypothetical protein